MAPLRSLSDADAQEMLDDGLPLTIVAPALLHGQLHHPAIEVLSLWGFGIINKSPARAIRLRRNMEALRRLSCCRGFDPEQNPAFWREYFAESGPSPSHRLPRDLFRCFRIVCDEKEIDAESLATAMWTLLSPSAKSDVRTQQFINSIERKVEKFLEQTPPPPQVSLCVRESRIKWATISQAMELLNRMAIAASVPTKVRLMIGESMAYRSMSGSSGLVDIVRMPNVHLVELHARCGDRQPPTAVSSLFRELSRVDTVQALSWDFDCDPQSVGAIFSAVASMASLSSLTLVCSHGWKTSGYCGTNGPQLPCRYWSWLAYALTQRKLAGLPLALDLGNASGASQQIHAACQQKNCLVQIVSTALGTNDSLVFCAHGVTAVLAQGTIMAALDGEAGLASVTIDAAQRVNVIATFDESAVVVIPGAGLMTTQLAALSGWQNATPALQATSRGRFLVSSLVLHRYSSDDASLLKIFGSTLTCIALVMHSRVKSADLDKILLFCPNLTKLALIEAIVFSFKPLLTAYAKRKTRISTLIFEPSDAQSPDKSVSLVGQVVDALATRNHPIRETLREFCEEGVQLSVEMLRTLARPAREQPPRVPPCLAR